MDTAQAGYETMMVALGLSGDDRTARRHVTALAQLTRGTRVDPRRHLQVTFPPTTADPGLISVRDVPFTSLCAHHMLPFTGTATVAYLPKPGGRIAGLSKLARLVVDYAARPQVQEQLAAQTLDAIMAELPAQGAAVRIEAVHTCMAMRGVKTGPGAGMVTVNYAGDLAAAPWRDEFAQLCR